jgi:hypothetical protein
MVISGQADRARLRAFFTDLLNDAYLRTDSQALERIAENAIAVKVNRAPIGCLSCPRTQTPQWRARGARATKLFGAAMPQR